MKEIIIDGINLTELKARADALAKEQVALRDSIRQGASKFIADNIADALAAVATMKAAETGDEARAAATTAYELLADAKFVSGVSGVSYSLPFSDNSYSYGGFRSEEIITSIIDDDETGVLEYDWRDKTDPLARLYSLAEDMESEVQGWNSSYC